MDALTLTLVMAIVAIWLSLTCGLVVVYLLLSGHTLEGAQTRKRADKKASTNDTPTEGLQDAPVLVDDSGASWGVQVLFDEPSLANNARLATVLAALGAVYENSLKAYTVAGESSRTPIIVENGASSLPLPAPDDGENLYVINALGIKITAQNEALKPSKLQLARLVKIAKAITKVGGTVVDAQKVPITKAGFKAVIAGKARV
ncbi:MULTISPECIES: hypothetical protein [unclassified Halomonas]|uniref:hypothetical protein n=1 Tax=unclassified Halomonas TaxID=2609666 RepID=UPI0020A0474F|nr:MULTISPECIES: hypothetical protein [unclassified Halomonas]MCP1314513.1 hypothetical protein [Halomonas sp. 707D7]MCP1325336.1 hypothetical protein [Halomonas sp. 707D4]